MGLARLLPVIVILLVTGCAPRDPLEQVVSVATPGRFAAWRAHIASDSGVQTRRRIEEALQEIRLYVAGERQNPGEAQRVTGQYLS